MKASMYIYPWDIIDYGVEPCLDLLKSLGVDQVSVAVNYHTAKLLLPHNPKRSVYFTEPGLLYFRPDRLYYDGPLRPEEASLTKGSEFLAGLIEAAGRTDIDVIAWIVCMHNSRLGFAFPEVTVETALGDRLLHTFCPVNPHTRAYVRGIVTDLNARFDITAFELESATFMGYFHGYHHEISGIDLTPSLDFLLSLCFCSSCIKDAGGEGIDCEKLRKNVSDAVRSELDRAGSLPADPHDLPEAVPGLGEFIEWRKRAIAGLVGTIKSEACMGRELITIATVFPPNADAGLVNGADPVRLSSVCDTVAVSGYFSEPEALKNDLDTLASSGITFENYRAGLRPQAPDSYDYLNFLAKLRILKARSFGAAAMYNFGTMRASTFDWIRRGLEEIR